MQLCLLTISSVSRSVRMTGARIEFIVCIVAVISELLKNIGGNYAKLRDVNSKLEEIGDAKSRARNLDVYKFQLNEIDKAKLKGRRGRAYFNA